ncbi:MAG TPA: hypothetical protein VGQ63_12030 [Pseudolabrys sp.]|jgi:hypothetical protein|nr:hypothetical protein [Pseudolabrys sp.]
MQRGKKTAAAIAAAMAAPTVIDGGFSQKPEPLEGLTEAQAVIWRKIVAGEPADFFSTETTREMLADLCRHRQEVNEFQALLDAFPPEALSEAKGMHRYEWLVKMRDKASKAAVTMATKLRLTNQSRWRPHVANTMVDDHGGDNEPWMVAGKRSA